MREKDFDLYTVRKLSMLSDMKYWVTAVGAVVAAIITAWATIRASENSIERSKQRAVEASDLADHAVEQARYASTLMGIPIGSIISSVLNNDQFSKAVNDPAEFDPTKTRWVPADGRQTPASQFKKIYNRETVPDLRGMFIRGVNSGRKDGKEDPDTREAGSYQSDELASHSHKLGVGSADSKTMVEGGGLKRVPHFLNDIINGGDKIWSTDPTGGTETRPKNVAVYYYIRIN